MDPTQENSDPALQDRMYLCAIDFRVYAEDIQAIQIREPLIQITDDFTAAWVLDKLIDLYFSAPYEEEREIGSDCAYRIRADGKTWVLKRTEQWAEDAWLEVQTARDALKRLYMRRLVERRSVRLKRGQLWGYRPDMPIICERIHQLG